MAGRVATCVLALAASRAARQGGHRDAWGSIVVDADDVGAVGRRWVGRRGTEDGDVEDADTATQCNRGPRRRCGRENEPNRFGANKGGRQASRDRSEMALADHVKPGTGAVN